MPTSGRLTNWCRERLRLTQMSTGFTSPRPRFCWHRSISTRRSSRRNVASPLIPVSSVPTVPCVIASSFLGQPQKAIDYADKAIRLSPRDPILYVFYLVKGFALSLLHQDDQAIGWLRRAGAAAPQWPLPQALLAAELSLTGREAEAHDVLKRYLSLSGTRARTIAQWKGQMPSNNPLFLTYAARLVDGLRRAGLPE